MLLQKFSHVLLNAQQFMNFVTIFYRMTAKLKLGVL